MLGGRETKDGPVTSTWRGHCLVGQACQCQCRPQLGFGVVADQMFPNGPVRTEDEGGRNAGDAVAAADGVALVNQRRKGIGVVVKELARNFEWIAGDRDDGQIPAFLRELLDVWERHATGRTPGCPEIDKDKFAAE